MSSVPGCPPWCSTCSVHVDGGVHRSRSWRVVDGSHVGCVSIEQRRGGPAEVVVSGGPVVRGWSADGAEDLADALEEAAGLLRRGR